jgi:hypothetical protein
VQDAAQRKSRPASDSEAADLLWAFVNLGASLLEVDAKAAAFLKFAEKISTIYYKAYPGTAGTAKKSPEAPVAPAVATAGLVDIRKLLNELRVESLSLKRERLLELVSQRSVVGASTLQVLPIDGFTALDVPTGHAHQGRRVLRGLRACLSDGRLRLDFPSNAKEGKRSAHFLDCQPQTGLECTVEIATRSDCADAMTLIVHYESSMRSHLKEHGLSSTRPIAGYVVSVAAGGELDDSNRLTWVLLMGAVR